MAQQGAEASVASTTTNPNWWDMVRANPISSWTSWQQHQQQLISPDSSSCVENISISTNASETYFRGEPMAMFAEDQLWNHVLLSSGNGAELHQTDHGDDHGGNLSDLLTNWSSRSNTTTTTRPQLDHPRDVSDVLLDPNYFSQPNHETHNNSSSTFYSGYELSGNYNVGLSPSFLRPAAAMVDDDTSVGFHQVGLRSNNFGIIGSRYSTPCSNTRNLSDLFNFGVSETKTLESSDSKKEAGHDQARGNVVVKEKRNPSEGKKKRSGDTSNQTLPKKSKHDNSNSSAASATTQMPKVKLGGKITALQQLVSPFGKTDTASVLMEAITHIDLLHKQVELLSVPYIKSGPGKDKLQLRSRGLCVVPISSTPQIYRESTGADYWTPTYRACLYK